MNWYRYLRAAALAMAVVGALFVLAPSTTASAFGLMVYRDAGFPEDFSAEAKSYVRLAHNVMGAVMVGWFLTMTWVIGAAERGAKGAWEAAMLPFAAWFLLDTSYSLLSGYWQNALLNTSIALVFLPGFLATHPARHPGLVDQV